MVERIKKNLINNKGNGILAFIIVLSVTALLAISILPSLKQALGNRVNVTIDYYNGTDTITTLD